MAGADKVIITCAITGAIHTPTMSPYLPITADQIAAEAIAAAEAGAAILHLHARDPENWQARSIAGGVCSLLAPHQAEHERRDQHYYRRQSLYARRGARASRSDFQAGSRLAEHGIDELRLVSSAPEI